MQNADYAPSRSARDLTTGLSDHERESRSSIEADADCDDRWNGRGDGGEDGLLRGQHPRHVLHERRHRAEAVLAWGREGEEDRQRVRAVYR